IRTSEAYSFDRGATDEKRERSKSRPGDHHRQNPARVLGQSARQGLRGKDRNRGTHHQGVRAIPESEPVMKLPKGIQIRNGSFVAYCTKDGKPIRKVVGRVGVITPKQAS